ncbi:MAG: F0F1 ATP synthase subunit B, partial [Gammaproteobacteria bacterium]|nr:F0F1 ATP synthase subunit B [Gammaproteobacteria bacterium]
MNINLTLIGQSITFALFVWFCYAFIWPPLVNALEKRKKQIADGLAAAERGQHDQELAAKKAAEQLKEAKG